MIIKHINLNTYISGKDTFEKIFTFIETEAPDILALQEICSSTKESDPDYYRTYDLLKDKFGYEYGAFVPTFFNDYGHGKVEIGNAILSKYPLHQKNVVWLKGGPGQTVVEEDFLPALSPRNLLHCELHAHGKTYNVMTLQGVWAKDGTETEDQKAMGKILDSYVSTLDNVILAGDFNVNPWSDTVKSLEKNFNNIYEPENRKTSFNLKYKKPNSGYATAVVDYVFTSRDIPVIVFKTSDADVSDHLAQITILDL